MQLRAFAIALLVLAVRPGVACAGPGQFDEVSLKRGPCYRYCPAYTVTVMADGTVRYEGRSWVKVVGKRTKRLGPVRMKQIRKAIADVRFFELRDQYESEEDGCQAIWTDSDSAVVVLKAGGVTKTVIRYDGCRERGDENDPSKMLGAPYPRRLAEFEDTLDRIIGTREWVGAERERVRGGRH